MKNTVASPPLHSKLDRFFKLTERGTNVKTEVIAGITTFLTMVFLISVHPGIMANAGMDKGAMATLTIVSAAVFTLICGLVCNIPFAMATGMGANAIIAFSIVGAGVASWQVALGMNFIAGVVFVLIGLFNLQDKIVQIIPKGIKLTMGGAIGLFITVTGLSNVKLVDMTAAGFLKLGGIRTPEVVLTGITLALILVFTARRMKMGILIAMVLGTLIGIPMGLTTIPDTFIGMPPSMEPVMFKLDIMGALNLAFVPFILALFMGAFSSTIGNLLGIGAKAGLLDKDGNYPGFKKPFMLGALGSLLAPVLGTNNICMYVQSAAGVEAGGRTGLTSVSTAGCFLATLFLVPVSLMVPNAVSSATLIIIGFNMLTCLAALDFSDFTEYLPAIVSVVGTGFTYNIATGLSLGIISSVIVKVGSGRFKELHWSAYLMAAALCYYMVALA